MTACKWLVGIDEAGRGPLAGPVAVGVVLVPKNFNWKLIPGVNDSKQLTAEKREAIYVRTLELVAAGKLWYAVKMPSAKEIDKGGIVPAIRNALAKALTTVMLQNPAPTKKSRGTKKPRGTLGNLVPRVPLGFSEVMVKLDGSLYAPLEYIYQETIIKGDAKEKVIGLASIMAKVTRDRYMRKISNQSAFVVYNFACHKGYATLEHRTAISLHGLSPEHRRTYCRNFIH